MTRHVHRLLVVVGCFGLVAALASNRSQAQFSEEGVKKGYECAKRACKSLPDKQSHPSCKYLGTEYCIFDVPNQTADVIWCAPADGESCEYLTPIQDNKCIGVCLSDDRFTCDSISWQKCKNPKAK